MSVLKRQSGARYLEGRRSPRNWRAYPRTSGEFHFVRLGEQQGRVFLEREGHLLGALECLDLLSGEPQWMYVYQATPFVTSTGLGLLLWEKTRSQPPKGTVVLPPSYDLDKLSLDQTLELSPRKAPVVFDPIPGTKTVGGPAAKSAKPQR